MVDHHSHHQPVDPACAMAHGDLPPELGVGTLIAVFASPVAGFLLHFGREAGYHTMLVEPDASRLPATMRDGPHRVVDSITDEGFPEVRADVVITDHDRPELGDVLDSVLRQPTRWIGVMGSPRHSAPHIAALRERGVADTDIARVHRPIGLNIGSKSPADIAIATLAGLIADRNGRPGGFDFPVPSANRS